MKLKLIIVGLLSTVSAYAMENTRGACVQGGQFVVTSGVNSTTKVQQTFVSCTVSVFLTGTGTLATIFTATGVSKANPFTADVYGNWNFSAANGTYDVQISNGGPPAIGTPYTFAAIKLFDGGLALYNNSGTITTSPHTVSGTATLSGGTATVTLAGLAVFTSASTYVCAVNDLSAAALTTYARASGTQVNITGTGTHVVSYICVGN